MNFGLLSDISKNDLKCLTVAPWSNTVGFMVTLDQLINHRTVIYLPRFVEEQYLSSIEKYKVIVNALQFITIIIL